MIELSTVILQKYKMIVLVVSVMLIQIWITAGSECGLAPHVTINCTDGGSAHVDWATSCKDQFDCKAYWACRNGTDHHHEESSNYTCISAGWDFSIPWNRYFCQVTVYYKFHDEEISPRTIKNCSQNSIELQYDENFEVSKPHEVVCILYTVNSDNVNISWIGPDGVITNDSSRITVNQTTSDGYIHTSTLKFSYISEEDENTSYNCTASPGEHESLFKSFTMTNLTISPDVTPTPVNSTLDGNHEVMLSTIIKTPAPDNSTFEGPDKTPPPDISTSEGNHEVTLSTIIIPDKTPTPDPDKTPTSNNSATDGNHEDTSTSFPVALVISAVVMVIVIGFTVGLTVYVICKGKRIIKFRRANSQDDDESEVVPPIDDIYTVQYRGETSTIDYEYLKSHDNVKRWLEMPALDEECSSICSPSTSVTNEIMLDYVVNGHNTKECNTKTVSTHDTDYCTSTENYNATAITKNDTGYYSGSSESLTQENGSYVSEQAAFSKIAKPTCMSFQEKDHLDNMVEEEELFQSAPSQNVVASPIPSGYITLESQQLSHIPNTIEIENNRQGDLLSKNTTSDQKLLLSNEKSVEETNENGKSPAISEGGYFPETTAEIQPTSNSLTNPAEYCENINSPVISEGEYLPYTFAINQHDPDAVTTLSENCTIGMYNAISMESVKQGTPQITDDSFPYVTLDEDNPSHAFPHTHASTDKMTIVDINGCDASCITDVISHSESYSDVFSAIIEAQDQFVDYSINVDQQSMYTYYK